MDQAGARDFMERFARRAREANQRQKQTQDYWDDSKWVALDQDLQRMSSAANAIASHLDPTLGAIQPDRGLYATVWDQAHQIVQRAIGVIDHMDELSSIIGGVGPTLDSSNLHPWVWSVASPIWPTGMYRHAVQTAGTNLDNMVKAKLGRTDVSGSRLADEAWSAADPGPDRPRLRPRGFGSPGDETYDSALGGARELHKGAMQRIRNVATHAIDELDEQVALEQLATLSLVARLVDDAKVIEASG